MKSLVRNYTAELTNHNFLLKVLIVFSFVLMDVHVCNYQYGGFVLLVYCPLLFVWKVLLWEIELRHSFWITSVSVIRSSDHVDLPTFIEVTEVGKGFFLYWRHHYRGNIINVSFFLLSSSVQVFRANHIRYDIITVFLLQIPTCNRFSRAAWNTQRTIWRLISLFFLCPIFLMLIYWCIHFPLCLFSIHTSFSSLSRKTVS